MKKILFNASLSGGFLTDKQGTTFTEVMAQKIIEMEKERDTGLNANGNKVKFEGTKKPEELAELIKRRDAPEELSDTAKAIVKQTWRKLELGIVKQIKSKFLEKGTYNEEDSISLLTDVENVAYVKNTERRENDYFTGECDIFKDFVHKKIVIDTKTSWDAETFMNAKPSLDNEVQGEIYMELWDADEFHLKFCLIDCPPHLLEKEKHHATSKFYDKDMSDEELNMVDELIKPIHEQIERNLIYSNNPNIKKEDCIKTFIFKRDREKYKKLESRAKLGQEYYKTIRLNGTN